MEKMGAMSIQFKACKTKNINGETNRTTEGVEGKFHLCALFFGMGFPFVCFLFFLSSFQASEGRG